VKLGTVEWTSGALELQDFWTEEPSQDRTRQRVAFRQDAKERQDATPTPTNDSESNAGSPVVNRGHQGADHVACQLSRRCSVSMRCIDAAYRCSVSMHACADHIIGLVYRRPNETFVGRLADVRGKSISYISSPRVLHTGVDPYLICELLHERARAL